MDYNQELKKISESTRFEITSFVEEQEKNWGKYFLVFLLIIILLSFDSFFFNRGIALFSTLFSFLGAFFISISVIRRKEEVVVLSMARIGYSKPLAYDLIKGSYLNAMGLFLIVISGIMQSIILFFN